MNPQLMQFIQQAMQNPNVARNLMGALGKGGLSQQLPQRQTQQPTVRGAEEMVDIRSSQRPRSPGGLGKIKAQEGDQPERRRTGRIDKALSSMLMSAPMALAGFALYKGGQNALAEFTRRAQAAAAADGEEADDVDRSQQTEGESPPEKKPSLVQQALKGIDIANLEDFQSNRLKPLVKKLESLEGQGKGPDDKTVADLIGRIKKIGGMGVAEQERERFDQAYGQFGDQDENIARQQQDRLQPDRAARRVKDEPGLEVGDLVETKAGKNGRVKEVDLERGIAKIQIDKKVHTKNLSDLKKKEWNELKSAVIEEHAYSPDLNTALLKFRKGPWYAYQDVPEDSFERLAKGKGTARTTGQANGFKWWKGKNPSMGAAFWKEIRDKNPYSRLDETIDVDYFFTNFDQISPDLPWQVPAPKKKKRKKR